MRTLKQLPLLIPVLMMAALSWAAPASAADVPFKVYITELWQLDDNVDPVIGVIADYYAKVFVNGIEINNFGACDDSTSTGILVPFRMFKYFDAISECNAFRTPWVFTYKVPAGQPVHVKIQIFDADLIFDDHADLKPGDGDDIEFDVDPVTGKWSGDVTWPQTCSRPGLSLGGNNANMCFQASFDTDDDGLLDVWENFGVDTDNDGVIDLNLPALGANAMRPDVFVEADFLQAATHSHRPLETAISSIVKSFANAPVSNPDGTTGIQLHVDVGSIYGANRIVSVDGALGAVGTYGDYGGGGTAIAEAGNEVIDAFGDGKGPGVDFADLKAANFNPLREPIFRYVIWGHQTNARVATSDCTSGVAHQTRRDFLVTLGGTGKDTKPCWGTDLNGFSVGSVSQQSGTFMHELGHTLSLGHGGADTINNKPNYLSVMNYTFQSCSVPVSAGILPGGCDYSRILLPALDETNLDECVGIQGGLGFGSVDWNANGVLQGISQCGPIFSNTFADVNNDGVCVSAGPDKSLDTTANFDDSKNENSINDGPNRFCDTKAKSGTDDVQTTDVGFTPTQPNPLNSHEDWHNLKPSLIDDKVSWIFVAGQEPDPDTVNQARSHTNEMTAPNVVLTETGPATGKPGDVLNYTVDIKSTGRGPALSSVLSTTSPNGTAQAEDLGTLAVGSEITRATSFTVPANACPGDFTGAGASLAFKNFVGDDLSAASTVPLQILDVSAPAVTLSLSPNVLSPPDHKFVDVTATITITDNCDKNPTVTLVSITSNEPPNGKDPDIQGAAFGTDDRVFSLRSERAGNGTGRIYTVTYRVTDKSGNATVQSAIVTVPHDDGK